MGRHKKVAPTASCPYCFSESPADVQLKNIEAAYRISSFNDICDKHQISFLQKFQEEDRPLAIETVNVLGKELHPVSSLFLAHVPYFVEEKKKRDNEWSKQQSDISNYALQLKDKAMKRLAADEARRAELEAKGMLIKDETGPKNPRKPREPKKSEHKKLSRVIKTIGRGPGDLLPSQLMELASGAVHDAERVHETVPSDIQKDGNSQKRRGRKPKRP